MLDKDEAKSVEVRCFASLPYRRGPVRHGGRRGKCPRRVIRRLFGMFSPADHPPMGCGVMPIGAGGGVVTGVGEPGDKGDLWRELTLALIWGPRTRHLTSLIISDEEAP